MRYALRAVGESVTATRRLLAGAPAATWGRLAVLVAFVGGLTTPLALDFNRGPVALETVTESVAAPSGTVLAAVAVGAVLALALFFLGTIFEFVFLEALRGEPIRLVAGGRRWWHAGVQVFAFRLVVLALAAVGAVLGSPWPAPFVAPLAFVGGLFFVLDRLTVAFVVPIMFVGERSLLAGWRAFIRTLRADWREYVAYLFVAGGLWLAVAVGGGLLAALVAVALAVPLVAFGAAVAVPLVGQGLPMAVVGCVVGVALTVPYLVVVLGAVLLVRVPLSTYLRYLALFVLGDTVDRYDPIPRVRAAVRK